MAAYEINFSDPLKSGFSIPPGGFNGPGAGVASTTLRLYGRGAVEWGEAVDEDLVRLTENFASASAPSSPISGQLWAESSLYYHDDNAAATSGWWFYDVNEAGATKWKKVNTTGVVSAAAAGSPAPGHYYWDAATSKLMGRYSLGKYEPIAYVVRSHFTGPAANPNTPALLPKQYLRLYDGATKKWTSPQTTSASGTAPQTETIGQFWYNTTTGVLYILTPLGWQPVIGPSLNPTAPTQISGVLNMNSYKIINLATPTAATDAANKGYVDTAAADIIANSNFLPLTGGTLAGPGNLVIEGAQKSYKSIHSMDVYHTLRTAARQFGQISVTLPLEGHNYSAFGFEKSQGPVGGGYVPGYTGGFAMGMTGNNEWFVGPTPTPTFDGDALGGFTPGKWHQVPTSAAALTINPTGAVKIAGTFEVAGKSTFNDTIDMKSKRITFLGSPVDVQDATTKQYVDSSVSTAVTNVNTTTSNLYVPKTDSVVVNPVAAPKTGDLRLTATIPPVVEIYVGGNWVKLASVGAGEVLGQPSITGMVTFFSAQYQNRITLPAGAVDVLGLELGDVIRVTGVGLLPNNRSEFTITGNLPTAGSTQYTLNSHHAPTPLQPSGGAKRVANQSTSATITRIAKWYNAPIGLGQGWVNMTADRPYIAGPSAWDTHPGNRSFVVQVTTGNTPHYTGLVGYVDGVDVASHGADQDWGGGNSMLTMIVPAGAKNYNVEFSPTASGVANSPAARWMELR